MDTCVYGSNICYQAVPSEKILAFFFSSELHYIDGGGSKFYHVARPPATVLPGGKSTMKGKNGYAKTSILDFPLGKLAI